MISALKWIKENIESFGGDSGNITLFGQSAGGDAIARLMISEGAEGLFQKVIIQSAPLGITLGRTEMSQKMMAKASRYAEDASTEEWLSAQKAVQEAARGYGFKSAMPFSPQFGFPPLPPERQEKQIRRKKAPSYTLLIGSAREETSLYVPFIGFAEKMSKIPVLGKLFRKLFIRITTRKVYGKPAKAFARDHQKAGGQAYLYDLFWGSKTNGLGASHIIDLPLLLGSWEQWKNAEIIQGISHQEVSEAGKKVRKLWASFAREGRLEESGTLENILTYHRL